MLFPESSIIHHSNGTVEYIAKYSAILVNDNWPFQIFNFIELLICICAVLYTILALREFLSQQNYGVILVFMIAIMLRFILFAYSFVSCEYGEKLKHFYSKNHHKDPINTSVGEETLDMYKWRGWIGLINLIILFFMYFYILKMHAFQARCYYE